MKKVLKKIFNYFGLTIIKSSTYNRACMPNEGFTPLKQLFYKNLHSNFYFVQIGANDGISFDPIYDLVTKNKVNGIAIEPIKDIFEKLKINYSKYPQVELLNLAIHKTKKKTSLFRVNPVNNNYPKWTQGTPSFNKEHHKLGGIKEEDIVEEIVDCINLKELILKKKIKHIDLLQIDTEGYDEEIIKMIDFNNIKPKIISFEHGMKQGIMNLEDFQKLQNLLFKNGYQMVILDNDAIAYID